MLNLIRCLITASILLGLASARGGAAPIVSVQSVVIAPGGTSGSFLVQLGLPASDPAPIQVSGFTVDLSVASIQGVQVVNVDYPAAGYLFAGNSFNQSFSISLVDPLTLPGNSVFATDVYDTAPAQLNPGDLVNLIEVFFTNTPNTGQTDIIVPVSIGLRTDLNDENFASFPFTTSDGTITLKGASVTGTPVPEPGTFTVVTIALLCCGAVRWRSRALIAASR